MRCGTELVHSDFRYDSAAVHLLLLMFTVSVCQPPQSRDKLAGALLVITRSYQITISHLNLNHMSRSQSIGSTRLE